MKSLTERIEEYPSLLKKALMEKARLEQLIEYLEESEEEFEDLDESLNNIKETKKQEKEQAKLEAAIDKLKIRVIEAEGLAEVAHRRDTPRATESSARAAVRSDPLVNKYKQEMVDLEEKKAMLDIEISQTREEMRIAKRLAELRQEIPATSESPKLTKARKDLQEAEIRIEELQAMFDSYKLLVQLERPSGVLNSEAAKMALVNS